MRRIDDLTILEVFQYYKLMQYKDRATLRNHLYEFYIDYEGGQKKLMEHFKSLTDLHFLALKQQLYTNMITNYRNTKLKRLTKEEKITLFSPPEMQEKELSNILRSQIRSKSQITVVQDAIQAQEQMKASRRLEREKRELETSQHIKACEDSIKVAQKAVDFDPTGSAFALYTGKQETKALATEPEQTGLSRSKGPIQYKPFRPQTVVLNPGKGDNIHFKSSGYHQNNVAQEHQQIEEIRTNKSDDKLNVQALTTKPEYDNAQPKKKCMWKTSVLFDNLELLTTMRNHSEMLKLEYQQKLNLLEQITTNKCLDGQRDRMNIIKYRYKVKSLQDRLHYLDKKFMIAVAKYHDIINAIYTMHVSKCVMQQ